jgi:glycosyltransferase involved in cell wall biosynthesis
MKVATIVARHELARARTLAASLQRHAPAMRCVALLLDGVEADVVQGEAFEQLLPGALAVDDFALLAASLEEEQLRRACQPLLLAHLLGASPQEAVLYVGVDSLVLGPLDEVERAAQEHGVVVWARAAAPLPADGRRPHEEDLRHWGLYDDGLVAFGAGANHDEPLAWWASQARASDGGAAALERLVSLGAHVFADAGIGASFWNLGPRRVEAQGERVLIDGSELRLLRLSGFDPSQPQLLSVYQDRLRVEDMAPLGPVLEAYAAELGSQEEAVAVALPYRWELLPDGTRLDARLRAIWARASEEGGLRRSPFTPQGFEEFCSWLSAPAGGDAAPAINRLCALICEVQPEIGAAFADLSDPAVAQGLIDWLGEVGAQSGTLPAAVLPPVSNAHDEGDRVHRAGEPMFGVNVVGYFSSELGVGEVARLIVASLDSVELSALPVRALDAPPTRAGHPYTTVPTTAARFPFNLIAINADGLGDFHRAVGRRFFAGRYTIGMWWWEVGTMPASMQSSFAYLDELWVGSEHVARALAAESPVPLYTITLPVIRPAVSPLRRARIGLGDDDFMFLFMFDYNSVFERKNPLDLIDAFARAFAPGSGAKLVIKAINGEHDARNRERLRRAAQAHPDVALLEGHMCGRDNHALIASCDCYVSLHRSEGFALTPAEAMALGKPVIATAYSGNLEYMTSSNSYLVDFEMAPIGPGNAPYPPEGEWAQPDTAHAASLMAQVFADQASAAARGARAAADVARTHSLQAAGRSMQRRLEGLSARLELPQRRLVSLDELVVPAAAAETGGGVRSRVRRFIGHTVRRSIEEDLVALREGIYGSQRAIREVDLTAIEAANDAARTLAATLASLRRLQAGSDAESGAGGNLGALGNEPAPERDAQLSPAPARTWSSSPSGERVGGEPAASD